MTGPGSSQVSGQPSSTARRNSSASFALPARDVVAATAVCGGGGVCCRVGSESQVKPSGNPRPRHQPLEPRRHPEMAVTEPDVVVAMTATPALRIDTEDTPADFRTTRVQGGLLHRAIGSVREPHSTRPTPPCTWPSPATAPPCSCGRCAATSASCSPGSSPACPPSPGAAAGAPATAGTATVLLLVVGVALLVVWPWWP